MLAHWPSSQAQLHFKQPSPVLLQSAPGLQWAWTWWPWGPALWLATAGQQASRPAQQPTSSQQQAGQQPEPTHSFSAEWLDGLAEDAHRTLDLTERFMKELQEEAPSQVNTAELQRVTQLIAEGRRQAWEVGRLAQTPSQVPRATIIKTVLTMEVCSNFSKKANDQIKQAIQLRQSRAGKAMHSPPASSTAPAQPPAPSGPWPPAFQALTQGSVDARASAAEASAAAAMAWASAAVGHEAAAEAAEKRAAAQPAAQKAAVAAEWAQAAAAWRAAFDALEAAAQANPGSAAVKRADTAVREARRFKSQRAGLEG